MEIMEIFVRYFVNVFVQDRLFVSVISACLKGQPGSGQTVGKSFRHGHHMVKCTTKDKNVVGSNHKRQECRGFKPRVLSIWKVTNLDSCTVNAKIEFS